jgi:hypothetical protein
MIDNRPNRVDLSQFLQGADDELRTSVSRSHALANGQFQVPGAGRFRALTGMWHAHQPSDRRPTGTPIFRPKKWRVGRTLAADTVPTGGYGTAGCSAPAPLAEEQHARWPDKCL